MPRPLFLPSEHLEPSQGPATAALPGRAKWLFLLPLALSCFFSPWHVFDQVIKDTTPGITPYTAFLYLAVLALPLGLLAGRAFFLGITDFLAFCLVFWAFASVLWTLVPGATYKTTVLFYCACAATYVLVRGSILEVGDYCLLASATVAGSACTCLEVLYRFTQHLDEYGRYTTASLNPNYVAYALVTTTLVAYSVLHLFPGRRGNGLLAAFMPLALVVIVLTKCRGALISLALGATWVLASRCSRLVRFLLLLALLSLVLVILYQGSSSRLLVAINQFLGRGAEELGSDRLETWTLARAQFLRTPLFGIGPGALAVVNPRGIGAHNVFLNVATELGLIGFGLYFGAGLTGLWPAMRHPAGSPARHLTGLLIVCWLPIALSGMWDISPVAWLGLGLFSRLPRIMPNRPGEVR